MGPAAEPLAQAGQHDGNGQESAQGYGEDPEEGAIEMSAADRLAQGIRTATVASRALAGTVTAPGEVRINAYASALGMDTGRHLGPAGTAPAGSNPGFFQARGFSNADADAIARACVFQTIFRNEGQEPLAYDLND